MAKKGLPQPIRELIDRFDFEKVHKCMVLTDWKWTRTAINFEGVPSIAMMREWVSREFRELLRGKYLSSHSGGFKVSRYRDELQRTCYRLEFILEDGDTE